MSCSSWLYCTLSGLLSLTLLLGVAHPAAAQPEKTPQTDFHRLDHEFKSHLALDGSRLTINPGEYPSATTGTGISVQQAATFTLDPADIVEVKDEPLQLPKPDPKAPAFFRGVALKQLNAHDINALGSFIPGSLTLRREPGGTPLTPNKDYVVNEEWGRVELGPQGEALLSKTVYASYRAGRMRVDTVVVDGAGRPALLRGRPQITIPTPPEAPQGTRRLLNIWRGYGATTVTLESIFPALESAGLAHTASAPGHLPKTMAKLKSGKPVRIVCWGDSVTAGGNASTPDKAYVEQFRRLLHEMFPQNKIEVENISVGGSNSGMWLRAGEFGGDFFKKNPNWPADKIDFERVLRAKPDLVTLEFVNDCGLSTATLSTNYQTILRRVRAAGAELLLITPHFMAPSWMPLHDVRAPEARPYVQFIYDFARQNHLAVADASARWAHLWLEGIPYPTLLDNSLNHPDDRGHLLFAEELMKCFDPKWTK